jgi:Flp pilus assembly protein TadD
MRRRTFSLETPRESWRTHAALAAVVTISALTLWAVGCGDSRANSAVETERSTTISPATATTPVERAPAQPVVTGPVSFADARKAYRESRFEDAVALFTVYTAEHPEDPAGFYLLGVAHWKAGQHVLAIPALEQAITLDSTHVRAIYNLTRVLLETSRSSDALVRIEQGLALDSTASEGWRLMGRTRAARGQFAEAIASYTRAVELDSTDVWSMNNLGLIYLEQGKVVEAIGPLARALELKPESEPFKKNLDQALALGTSTGGGPFDVSALARAFVESLSRN